MSEFELVSLAIPFTNENAFQFEMVQSMLQSANIEYFLLDDSSFNFYSSRKIQVRAEDAQDAQKIVDSLFAD